MSSILTNNGAMVALQTLKSINSDMGKTQSMISTGKEVASAKDNAAVWAISKVMESDVKGFKGISDSLSLGQSTVAVARNASETATDLLTEIKGKIVAAQEENVDRGKLQTDIAALTGQVESVIAAAQFNGLNLVDGSTSGINVLSSLDRSSDGTVNASQIAVSAQNLSTTAGLDITAAAGTGALDATTDLSEAGGANEDVVISGFAFTDASNANTGTVALAADTAGVDRTNASSLQAGDTIELSIGETTGKYSIREGDTADSVATGLKDALVEAGLSADNFSLTLGANQLTVANLTNNADIAVGYEVSRGTGSLADLDDIDVTADPTGALDAIEGMLSGAIDAAAAFGSVEGRLETQANFISQLSDSLKSGIGSMVDADMEETSARLQALQVQQQLGVQSLSIANQAPQSILSLFR